MYTLVGSPNSRAIRVAWALEEIGAPYQWEIAGPQSEPVRAINPSGKVPVLRDGDDTISDSVAIIQYLADKHGAITHEAGTIARAQQDAMTQFACDELDGSLWTAAKHRFALPKEHRVPEVKASAAFEWARGCKSLEARLGGSAFAAGDTFTVADIIIAHCASWARGAKFDWRPGPVTDYFEHLLARPALATARKTGETAANEASEQT